MLEHLPPAIGHALQGVRAGMGDIAFNRFDVGAATGAIQLASLSFADHGRIPPRFTADGPGDFPSLTWTGVPAQAAALVVLVEDADAPSTHPFMHLSLLNLPPTDASLAEGDLGLMQLGPTSFFTHRWVPPDPPPGHGSHRYAFQIFALSTSVPADISKAELLATIGRSALASGLLIGTYERSNVEPALRAPVTA